MPSIGEVKYVNGKRFVYQGGGNWQIDKNLQGDSSYQTWLNEGNTGTEEDFLNSINPASELISTNNIPYYNGTKFLDSIISRYPDHIRIGTGSNYMKIFNHGTMYFVGESTIFRDEKTTLISTTIQNPSSHITQDLTEGTLDFNTSSDLSDWAYMNVQLNHDYKPGTNIKPHVHWFQDQASVPNWMISYRWQKQLQAKSTSWTSVAWASHATTYSSGTINQITGFGSIAPPEGYGEVSDIVQIRLYRDVANTSTLFGGADAATGNAKAVSLDMHIEVNSLGSDELYTKYATTTTTTAGA